MIFKINEESVVCCIVIFLTIFLRTIYMAIRNKRKFPSSLFEGKFLYALIGKIIFGTGVCVFAFTYSNDFYILGLFFTWLLLILCSFSLIVVLWIIFFMHGYDVRYLFKKVFLPCPMGILEIIIVLTTTILTRNWVALGLSVPYLFFSYIWDYAGYKLTEPKIPDYVVIKEDDEI